MKIVADENIPYVEELFAPLGEVQLLPGRTLTNADVNNANALLVRSVTPVNKMLLDDSPVQFVGTCTIGVDHLDTQYLQERAIAYASAPGCNANAVVQYIISVFASLDILQSRKNVVIVGGGNVGKRVYQMLDNIGFNCSVVDPFLDSSCGMPLVDFSAIYDADIICLHTPLTGSGAHPTIDMLAYDQLQGLKPGALLINAGRGGVINNEALNVVLHERKDLQVVLDVWADEPNVDTDLLQHVLIGTPHIAGYSFEGRVQGSLMIFDAFCKHFNIDSQRKDKVRREVIAQAFGDTGEIEYTGLIDAILTAYNVKQDFARLKQHQAQLPAVFDKLRKNYPKRREFSHFFCKPFDHKKVPPEEKAMVKALGFGIDDEI